MRQVQYLVALHPQATIVVLGHSLGGAQAVFSAIDMQLFGLPAHLYTYGQPRTGNQNFINFLNDRLVNNNMRAVYVNDPVPTVPPQNWGFSHQGTEIHFYDCYNYLAYPKFTDDSPIMRPGTADDHGGYFCLESSSNGNNVFVQ